MKKMIFIVLVLIIPLFLQAEVVNLVDIPTARTILRGYYDIDFLAYGKGGILTKISIGLTDRIMLGILEDVSRAIGSDQPDWNIPGVLFKVNLIYPEADSMGLAIGYDALLSGEYGHAYNNQMTDDLVYGFYAAITKPVVLFDGEQFLHFGARFPVLPNAAREKGKNISLYTGLSFHFGPEFMVSGELENIYLNGSRSDEMLYNLGVKYSFSEFLALGVNFQYTRSRDLNPTDKPSRSLRLAYQNIFY